MLGQKEVTNTCKLRPQMRTWGSSSVEEGWKYASMDPLDLSWQTMTILWNYELPAIEPRIPLGMRNTFYGLLHQERPNFVFQHLGLHAESWWVRTKLDSVSLLYCTQDPLRHIWQKFGCHSHKRRRCSKWAQSVPSRANHVRSTPK